MDLIIIIILTAVLAPLVYLTDGPLRIILGLIFVLFSPGYTLIAALFPKKEDLSPIERVALGFGLSIVVVPLIGLVLNYTPWGIQLFPILVSIASFIVVASFIGVYRRGGLPKDQRYQPRFRMRLPRLFQATRMDRLLTGVLVFSIVASIGTLAYVVAVPKVGEKFTEFYIVGLNDTADCYPTEFVMDRGDVTLVGYSCSGEPMEQVEEYAGRVFVGIVNHEYEQVDYTVEVKIDGEKATVWMEGDELDQIGPVELPDEGNVYEVVAFAPTRVGDNQKVEFILFKDGVDYLALHLWIDVKEAE